jgi:hypothetical protein
MEMTINVFDVVSEEEIKSVVMDAIRQLVIQQFSGSEENLNRLISNLSYSFVWDMIDQQFNGELRRILSMNISKIINGLSSFSVFRQKDAWGREDSVAYKILQEEMANARPLIKARVEQIVQEYPFHELQYDEIGEVVYQCVMDRLFAIRNK